MMRVKCPCHITSVTFHISLTLTAKAKDFPPSNSPSLQSSQYPKDQEKEKNFTQKIIQTFLKFNHFILFIRVEGVKGKDEAWSSNKKNKKICIVV